MLPATALELHSSSAELSGPGWRAGAVELRLAPIPQGLSLDLRSATLSVAGLSLDDARLHCPVLAPDGPGWRCPDLLLHADGLDARGRAMLEPATGTFELVLDELRRADDRFGLELRGTVADWEATLEPLAVSPSVLRPWFDPDAAGGRITGRVVLAGDREGLLRARFALQGRTLQFALAGGRYAGEALAMRLDGQWQAGQGFKAELDLTGGQLYLEPWFWDLDAAPVALELDGRRRDTGWTLDPVRLTHAGVLEALGRVELERGDTLLRRLAIDWPSTSADALNRHYLQPLLLGSPLEGVELTGQVEGRLELRDLRPGRLELGFDAFGLEAARGRFGLDGLDGRLHWGQTEERDSLLSWRGGHLYRLALGPGVLDLVGAAERIGLRSPSRIPLLDGVLRLQELDLSLGAEPRAHFGGRIDDISMASLSTALEWPVLSGSLDGVIPRVRYRDGGFEVDGALLIEVFGGDVTVANLKLDQAFGPAPELAADIELFRLDLEALTRTFDIGRILGRLSGHVRGLRLRDWRPVAFEAELHTPEGDESRHRISQRAVETLSDLGGSGAAGVVSRGFLGLFEDFGYDRLGIRCHLADGVCLMGGVRPTADGSGYYLVEGSGLPRIDIIGYNRRVDWPGLLARLQAAARSQGPVIE
ncbi:MAG: hypothetical protein R3202_02015 [Candidatus Competibacterales bacterium]|nr:hypothetical protein [Candidatus Competibacterales bacterium]